MKHLRKLFTCLVFLISFFDLRAQSLEMMVGNERIFADAQWLKFMDTSRHWSIFSRSRATVDYDNKTDLFTGAYLNYSTKIGIGASIVGKINSSEGGVDAGVHIFKARQNWMLFGLASVALKSVLEYSWFSILRFTPKLGKAWRLYTSLELFTLFQKGKHAGSVQRIRVGFDFHGFQFGLANNLAEVGPQLNTSNNFGVFIRKSF